VGTPKGTSGVLGRIVNKATATIEMKQDGSNTKDLRSLTVNYNFNSFSFLPSLEINHPKGVINGRFDENNNQNFDSQLQGLTKIGKNDDKFTT
jgi:hypothetical protein